MNSSVFCFDLDGTLLDHDRAVENAVEDFRKYFSCFATAHSQAFYQQWHSISEKYMDLYLEGQLSFHAQRAERIREMFKQFGESVDEELASQHFELFLERYELHWCLFRDSLSTLAKLNKENRLGIITNGDSAQQWRKILRFGFDELFDEVVISGDFGTSKPSSSIFLHFAERVSANPESIYYIGDKESTDAIAASKAGFNGIWLNRKSALKSARVPTIHSLSELESLHKGLP